MPHYYQALRVGWSGVSTASWYSLLLGFERTFHASFQHVTLCLAMTRTLHVPTACAEPWDDSSTICQRTTSRCLTQMVLKTLPTFHFATLVELTQTVHELRWIRSAQSGIKTSKFYVIRCGEEKAVGDGKRRLDEIKSKQWTETYRPSSVETSSRLFKRPHRLEVRPSPILAAALLGVIDAPVDVGSLLMHHANAASKSSNINIHL